MDPFIGEIRLMGFPFPPKGWQFCQGQLLPINQNQALFSLLGTTYGGNGTTTFGLPDLRGRMVLGVGSGPGLSPYSWGQQGGTEAVALTPAQMPPHGHTFTGTIQAAGEAEFIQPGQAYPATGVETQYSQGTPNATLGNGSLPNALATAGGGQPHENRQPTLVLNYAIAVQGIFPSRD